MTVTVNGKPMDLREGLSVAELIRELGLAGQPCAAEVNQEVVPRRQHADRALQDGDRVELVTLVGGG